jgi:hypothetical protein
MTKITYIPGEIANAAIDEHGNRKPVTRTQHIFDDNLEKPQSEVNQDRIEDVATLDGKIALEKQRAEGVESGLNNRLGTVEQLAEISIGGGDAQIATGADFTNPDATKRAKVTTVGAIIDGLNDGVYDVSKRNPTGGPNSDGKFTLDYILANANTLIPTGWRHGGMSISFVSTYGNKYVQWRYMGTATANADFANVANWQGVDDEPMPNSRNLVESGGVHANCAMLNETPFNFSIEDDKGMAILSIGNDFFKIANHLVISLQNATGGQILKYIDGIWTPSNNISSINDLVDMSDVDTGDVLKWNGSEWVGASTTTTETSENFSIEDETGMPIMSIESNIVSFGKNKIDFGLVDKNHILVFDGYKFVTGQPDWTNKVIATYGDSVTAVNNGNFERPYSYAIWGNIVANYFGFSKHYGRGIGSQMFTWAFNDGGSVAWVRPDGTYINRLTEYGYDAWNALSTKVYPDGVTAEMIAQGDAITIRGSGCSWLRITKMFPEEIKDTINVITIMYHNDVAENDSILDGNLQWIANDDTDTEWAASEEYATYGGDYNIMTTRGGIASTIMKLQAWMPNCVIVLATPISGRGTPQELNPELKDISMQKLAGIVREMSQLMSIPCIDVYSTCGINGLNRTRFIGDSIHPNMSD